MSENIYRATPLVLAALPYEMGRPRKHFSQFVLAVPVRRGLWERVRVAAAEQHVSISELARQLMESFLTCSHVEIQYRDSVHFRNLARPPDLATRRCVGWIVEETADCVKVVSDMPVSKLPGEVDPPGSEGYTISKADIVELKRVGCR